MSLNTLNNLLAKVDALDDILDCPVCYERLSGDVLQCTQGHHVCRNCWTRVFECPLCSSKFNGTRNYLVESIIPKFEEIKNVLKNLKATDLDNKNLLCTQAKKPEPTAKQVEKFPCGMEYCHITLPYNGMIFHISENHKKYFIDEGVIHSNRYNNWWTVVHELGKLWEKIIYIENMGIFFIKINISNKGNVYGYVVNAKPPTSTQTFYYKLKIDNPYDDDLYFDGPVVSTTISQKKGKYLCIEDAVYEDDDGDDCFDFDVKIIRVY